MSAVDDTFSFVVGAIVPIGCWYAHKRWPHMKLNKVRSAQSSKDEYEEPA